MDIDKIYTNVTVDEFHVKREGDAFNVSFQFACEGKIISAKLIGVRDIDDLCEIVLADRLWVERDESSQVEYGKYTLGISHECYTELFFDELL